ncbi:MAG: thioredoxin family protein, partial [Myxococcales bacterium]|nr:thioredoxin family protein [Myxococcales bacterium]
QPWWTTLAVFNALGIGMALPYLVLSLSPALLRRLPRPGAWMVRFKQLLAFPMYGAAAWLLWVLGSQAGRTGMLTAVIALIGLAFAGWLFGTTRSVERRRWIASSAALALSVVALYWGAITVRADSTRYRSERRESPSIVSTSGTRPPRSTGDSLPTLRYSPRALAALLARKQLVFLNMTADWCISCKVNERVALKRDVVQRALRTRGVRYMVGDWTSRDAAITEVLDHFKRNGVPLYLMLQPSTKRYMILPQVLTPSMVVEAVHKL